MYFSYLYGKQKEMLALRQLAPQLAADDRVQPLIEPVKHMTASLRQTLDACEQHGLTYWLVMNPVEQEFAGLPAASTLGWSRHLLASLQGRRCARAVLLAGPALTAEAVRLFALGFAGQTVGLVMAPGGAALEELLPLLDGVRLGRVFFKEQTPTPAQRAALRGIDLIRVERRAVPGLSRRDWQTRNVPPSCFSDSHLTYERDGYGGFSDFTSLPSWPDLGGKVNAPGHFHLSYLCRGPLGPTLWVQHFVPEVPAPGEHRADHQFRSALRKFRRFIDDPCVSIGPTEAAHRYLSCLINGYPPSQALNKQWEVMHHLELVSGLLAGRFAL